MREATRGARAGVASLDWAKDGQLSRFFKLVRRSTSAPCVAAIRGVPPVNVNRMLTWEPPVAAGH